jgi:flap endonuclease-1
MGINNLNKFLKDKYPNVSQTVHLSNYKYKKIAIDVSIYMCKFKILAGDRWLLSFLNLVALFRKNNVHCVMVYDGKSPPEKDAEKKIREETRNKQSDKVSELEDAIREYNLTGTVNQILIDLHQKHVDKIPGRLMKVLKISESVSISSKNIKDLEYIIEKKRSQILDISPEDFKKTRELFDILSVPYIMAPMEAETVCSDLCKRGYVEGVLSDDSDVMAYGSPIMLSKLNTTDGTCTEIEYSNLLESLELNTNEFLDFCIMCGCDYNKNIYKVGPVKAYSYIKSYSSIENIKIELGIDVNVLNYKRGRELFRDYEKPEYKVEYCGTVDFKSLNEFMFINNVPVDIEGVKKSFGVLNFFVE